MLERTIPFVIAAVGCRYPSVHVNIDLRDDSMCKHLSVPKSRAIEGVASLGNLNHWRGWCAALAQEIDAWPQPRPLTDAAPYVAWLLLSAERISYSLRWYLYAHSDLEREDIFDYKYKKLICECAKTMPPQVLQNAEFAVKVRHLFIHKGIPNPQKVPSGSTRDFSEDEIWEIRNTIKDPANFQSVKARFDVVHSWLAANTQDISFGP